LIFRSTANSKSAIACSIWDEKPRFSIGSGDFSFEASGGNFHGVPPKFTVTFEKGQNF